jgi:hypothetical protein
LRLPTRSTNSRLPTSPSGTTARHPKFRLGRKRVRVLVRRPLEPVEHSDQLERSAAVGSHHNQELRKPRAARARRGATSRPAGRRPQTKTDSRSKAARGKNARFFHLARTKSRSKEPGACARSTVWPVSFARPPEGFGKRKPATTGSPRKKAMRLPCVARGRSTQGWRGRKISDWLPRGQGYRTFPAASRKNLRRRAS